MKRHLPLVIFCATIGTACALVMAFGCCETNSRPDPVAAMGLKLTDIEKQIDNCQVELGKIHAKLDKLAERRIILPKPSTAAAPDVRAAIGFQLKAAAALVGKDKVIGFFQDIASDIRKTLVPLDPLGVADKKARELGGGKINELLTQ